MQARRSSEPVRWVHLVTASCSFHARVLEARLGAEGFVVQLRGPVDSLYPMGQVDVLVPAEDLDDARDLLLEDEVQELYEADGVPPAWSEPLPRVAFPVPALVALPLLGMALVGLVVRL